MCTLKSPEKLGRTTAPAHTCAGSASSASLGNLEQAAQHMYSGLRASRLLAEKLGSSCGDTLAVHVAARDRSGGNAGGAPAVVGGTYRAVHADEAVVDLTGDQEVWGRQYGGPEPEQFDGETEEEVVHDALR